MVDRFDISREQPQKEWWRERRVAPATFFGFPDVTKRAVEGGSMYVEQMDSVTLAVLADKCVKEGVWDPDIWSKFSWRAQQLSCRMHEPDLCYVFRAFARMDWFDQHFLTTYLGRIHRRLHMMHLPDVSVVLEGFANPKFRQSNYLHRVLTHLSLLLQHRDDAKVEDLARACAALGALRPLPQELAREVCAALELLSEALLLRDFGDLGASRCVHVLDCFVAWGLVGREREGRSNASADLCWALVRELKGQVRDLGKEKPEDLPKLAMAMAMGGLAHDEVWSELVKNLEFEAHRLSGSAAASAAYACALDKKSSPTLDEALSRRLHDDKRDLSAIDCARAAAGLLRAPKAIAHKAILRGPVSERIWELGFDVFDADALVLLLGALGRAPPDAWGVEVMAGALLEALHPRLGELSARHLAHVVHSLSYLRPESAELLRSILDRAQSVADATRDAIAENTIREFRPRHVAMLCMGIAAQPPKFLPDAPERIQALLPHIHAAIQDHSSALTAAQLLGSLVICPSTTARDDALGVCAERLESRVHDLNARSLLRLAEVFGALASAKGAGWFPPKKLVIRTAEQLDIKRYDLPDGRLGRAAQALEAAGAPAGVLQLEKRDLEAKATSQ